MKNAQRLAGGLVDRLSEKTGIVAMRDRLLHPGTEDVLTLEVPGYKQTNTFSCAVTAGLMVLHTFRPRASVDRFYRWVNPHEENGAQPWKLIRALRRSKVGVSERNSLTWEDVHELISDGFPIITLVRTNDPEIDHWVVIYGVGVHPNRIFIAANGWPLIGRREYRWTEFESAWWRPRGYGLVCWGK